MITIVAQNFSNPTMKILAQIMSPNFKPSYTAACLLSPFLPSLPPMIATLKYQGKITPSLEQCASHEAVLGPILADPSLVSAL